MATWNTGKVIKQLQWSEDLYSLMVESELAPFEAGQFVKIALNLNGEVVGRPYSLVNTPDVAPLEIFYRKMPQGFFSNALANLHAGDELLVAPQAHGFMVINEILPANNLWLLATGTGIGPFLSMLATAAIWQRYQQIILVYAVRTLADQCYQQRIMQLLAEHANQFTYIPVISRETGAYAVHGRIPQAISNGELELQAGVTISAEGSQVVLCGNPQMIEDTMAVLNARGLTKHRRKAPGQITVEGYWQ